jgi:cobalt-zinc-cadmium resistance protein CzcA
MLNALISWSLRHRFLVIALTLLLVITGAYSAVHLPVDAFPDTTPVQVQINTVAPALAPLEIEQQITFPVEQSISGLAGLVEVRSLSKFGLSQVTAIFDDGVDIYFARQLVTERLGTVELPEGLPRPTMGPVATGLGEVFHYVLTSQTRGLSELRTIQDWIIKPQLRSVPGVAEVNSWGGRERQYQVVVDPARLLKYDLTLHDVFEALERNNLNVGGGTITRAGESLLVQGVGRLESLEQIEGVVIRATDGVPVYVRDIGRVVDGHEIRRGAVTIGGRGEGVLGLGFMLMGENPGEVTQRMKERMVAIGSSLPDDVTLTTVYDRTELVDHVLNTVQLNLLEGAILVVAVLFAFLGNLRAGLVVAAAIPLSMLFAANAMLQAGIAGSLMSLGAIDFGLIVDSSVIQIENGMRHLAGNTTGRPRIDVVRDAAVEVRKPTIFGELIIMIVYLPILTLEGIEGKLFRPMALTVVFALAGSLILSLTLMPVLASLVLPRRPREREPLLVRAAQRVYAPVLDWALRRRVLILAGVALALGGGVFLASRLGTVFIPRLSEEAIVINTVRLAGVSVEESTRYGTQIERVLLDAFPDEIRHVWSRTGTAEVVTDPMGLELTDVFVTLTPRARWKRAKTQFGLVEQMEAELAGMPAMRTIFTQPIEMRVNEMVAGIRSDVGIKIFGDDFDTLKTLADRVVEIVRQVPGAGDVTVDQLTGQPMLEVRVRQDQLARYGVPAADVLRFVEAIGNVPVGEIRQGQTRFPLTVRLPDAFRTDLERVGNLLIPTASGQRLPLHRLADLRIIAGPSTIQREWSKRRIVVQCNARGGDMGGLVREIEQRLAAEVDWPTGYFVRYGGQFEHLQRAGRRLAIVVPLALLLVFLLLHVTYGRVADVLRIFMTLPLSAIGGVAALHLRGMPFSVSAGVGFVAMCGVSVLGDMVFVSFLRDLLDRGVALTDAIRQAARTRLRPVLMTGLVASLGFVPMAFNTGVGAEVQRPLATVVIGCVITSTLLTLLVLPVFYSALARRSAGG